MPTYDLGCQSCGQGYEIICPEADRNDQDCACGARLERLWLTAPKLVGPMPTKPHKIGGTDISFTRAEDLRNYEAFQEQTGRHTVSQTDPEWRQMVDDAKESANRMVQRSGFSDHQHFKREMRVAKAAGGNALKG